MVANYIKVCREDEVTEGQTRAVTVNDQPLILAKQDGRVYALEGICSHDGGEFEAGKHVVDCQIECPRHGARFDIKTGEATRMPAIVGINSYEIKIDNGDVYVGVDEQ
jgi:3-phenylpropionate/trans-cinnamate dioxygenase ferredoxin component